MSQASRWSCVVWDVDGTLIDASDAILRRLTATLEHFGLPAPTRGELSYWIGPPIYDSFRDQVGMTGDLATQAVAYYRALGHAEGYTAGVRLIPGIRQLIDDLARAGVPQGVASSKPEVQVRAILEHVGLIDRFASVTGASDDERTLAHKGEILAEELHRLGRAGVDTSRPVLVGDRHHDVTGGAEHGVPVVFVRWGFSWPHEAEGAAAAVDDVTELRAVLLPDGVPDAAGLAPGERSEAAERR